MKIGTTRAGRRLSTIERGHLAALVAHPGFPVLQEIFESQISQMQTDMINTDATDEKRVLANHNLAKSAAIFYQKVVDYINGEMSDFSLAAEQSKPLPDITESILEP